MAKLNKTRIIAAALLGTFFLSAPVASYASDFRTSSHSVNARIITSTFANRGISATRLKTSRIITPRFNSRNNIGFRQASLGLSKRLIGTPVIKVKSNVFTPKLTVAPLVTKKVLVKKPILLSRTHRGFK